MLYLVKTLTGLAAAITLISCANVVSKASHVETPTDMSYQEKLTIIEYVRNGGDGVEIRCEEFIMPQMEGMPELPKLSSKDLKDRYAVEEALTDHIAELREYVIDQKTKLNKDYLEYVRKCDVDVE